METEAKQINGRHRIKVDDDVVTCDSALVDKEGKVVSLCVHAPSREKADGKFGPAKLEESDNSVFKDAALKEGPCEVEVLLIERGWQSVWKGSAMRKFAKGSAGFRIGGILHAEVLLENLSPLLVLDGKTGILHGMA